MRTVKQVSDLTGVSVRTLHYYDEIGLLKPSEITEAGYRLYDDEALKTLQQILFFKELDIPLKDVKEIMMSPYFDKMQALKNQKKLLMLKRKRLNGLIELINKTLKGESTMNFKEFDMSEYYNVLEEFKTEHEDKVIEIYGSVDKYNDHIEKCKSKEDEIAKMAIKKYGSIEKYAKALKKNLNNSATFTLAEQYDEFKRDSLEDKHPKLKELFNTLETKLIFDYAKNHTDILNNSTFDQYAVDVTGLGLANGGITMYTNGSIKSSYVLSDNEIFAPTDCSEMFSNCLGSDRGLEIIFNNFIQVMYNEIN